MKTIKIGINKFFSFLFNPDVFNYWNVDISTARLIGKTRAMAQAMVYWLNKEEGFCGLAMRDTSSNLNGSVVNEIFRACRILHINGVKYSIGKRELTFPNGNIIYFRGAQTKNVSQITLAGFTPEYEPTRWIIWLEEVFQFTNKQYAEIAQAIRGAPKTIFSTSNPWLPENWYVKMLEKIQPFNTGILKSKGSIINSYINDEQKRLIIYASIENSPFVTKEIKAQLKNDCLAQPWMTNPVILGVPGILSGAIYAHLMDYVKFIPANKEWVKEIEFTVGVDFGEVSDSTSAVLIASIGGYKEVRVLQEFEYKPTRVGSLERHEIADLVNSKIIEWKALYKIKNKIQARFDNAAVVFGRRLQQVGEPYGIIYVPCSKKLINDRIDLVTILMAEKRLIFSDRIKILSREMKASLWKTDKYNEPIRERADGNDHMLNAFEYALERRHKTYHKMRGK